MIEPNGAQHFLEITCGLLTHHEKDGSIRYEIFEPSETLATEGILSLEEKFLAGEGQNITPARFSKDKLRQAGVSSAVKNEMENAAREMRKRWRRR